MLEAEIDKNSINVHLVNIEFWGGHYLCDHCKTEWDALTDTEKEEPLERRPIEVCVPACRACLKEKRIVPS
jgi:hypothetical protein